MAEAEGTRRTIANTKACKRTPKTQRKSPPVGLEPTIFGLEVQRVIQLRQEGTLRFTRMLHGNVPKKFRKLTAKYTHDGTRTHNLSLRRGTRYPFRHAGSCALAA